jgi:hypothetical protein
MIPLITWVSQQATGKMFCNIVVLATLRIETYGRWTNALKKKMATMWENVATVRNQILRHCTTSRKDAGLIPDGVIGFFI